MNHSFTFKDFLILLLLAVLILLHVLKMVQDDRQWDRLRQILDLLHEQTRDLAQIRRRLDQLASAPPSASRQPLSSNTSETASYPDVFRRIRQAQAKPDYARGDWIIEAFGQAVPTLNPLTSQDIYAKIIEARVVESLGVTDIETLETIPLLARSWQMAPDGLSATFRLREGLCFSDGHPLTADDVVATYELLMNPQITDGRIRQYYRIITGVEKLGPLEVRFHFEKPFYESFDRAAGMGILPRHLYEGLSPQEIRDHPALLMGSGPYRLPDPRQYTPGQTIELIRNERYWGEPGPWDRIVYRLIEKESTELVAFRNGEIDIFGPTPEQHMEMLKDADLLARKQYYVYETVRAGYSYIAWNQRRGGRPTVFADKRVRQAMTMLIDRQRLVDEIFLGMADIATGPFHHLGPQYDPSVKPWPYDPQRALALLQEAGFRIQPNGPLLSPDGKAFSIELTYPAGSEIYERVVLFLRDNFARAGIELKPNPQQWALLLKTLNERNFEAITLGWSGGLEVDIEQMFHSRTIPDGDNRNSYSNPELDALIDQAHVTLDRQERMRLWQACHRILHEDQPYTFLTRPRARLWLDKRIANVQRIPGIGLNSVPLWPIPIEWYVPRELQVHRQP